jgi:hypothetical protein
MAEEQKLDNVLQGVKDFIRQTPHGAIRIESQDGKIVYVEKTAKEKP